MSAIIGEVARERIKARKPFNESDDKWLIGYRTKGGTYILASNGRQSDSMKPRDLVAITPGGIVSLYYATNPDFIAELEELLS